MTLTDFLNNFEFDYCLYNDDNQISVGLIDLQGANLGDIENERYELSSDGISAIIDRLDVYYQDYIFTGLSNSLKEEYGIEIDENDWKGIYQKIKELNLDWDMNVLPYIFGDKELIFDKCWQPYLYNVDQEPIRWVSTYPDTFLGADYFITKEDDSKYLLYETFFSTETLYDANGNIHKVVYDDPCDCDKPIGKFSTFELASKYVENNYVSVDLVA